MKMTMPGEVEWIIGRIREHGYEAFAVGGCVRDTLLGRKPEDWDITTSARPEAVKAMFPRTVDTGLKHGTVTIIKNKKGYEVTTYRIDGEYLDGRHPDSVEFTANLTEDLKRRDFTINAMAYSHETGIVDEFGGMEDLKNCVIRCVGLAKDRFSEDALRLLRAIRFSAQLDFAIEKETYQAIYEIAPNLLKVSRERVQTELTKLLLSAHPERILLTEETGLSSYVAPGFPEALKEPEGAAWYGAIASLPAEKSMRWAGLLRHRMPKQAAETLKALKLDNETIGNVQKMLEGAQMPLPLEKPEIRRMMSRLTSYQMEGALNLKAMDGDKTVPEIRKLWNEILEAGDCVSLKALAVGGKDLMEAGIERGPVLGETLNRLLEAVLKKPELNTRETLLKMAGERAEGPEAL